MSKSGPRHIRHTQLLDLIWWAVKRAQISASMKPVGLSRSDGKQPNVATYIPWKCGTHLAWDIIVFYTYAASHIDEKFGSAVASANKVATNKITKYNRLATTHLFIPFTIETEGPWTAKHWNSSLNSARDLLKLHLEMQYLFKRLSISLQRGNQISFRKHFYNQPNYFYTRECVISDITPNLQFLACSFVLTGAKNNNLISEVL